MQDLITVDRVALGVSSVSKKQLFQELAALMTGVGHGVALPHARVAGITKVYAAFIRLDTPMDYEAIDDRPVDLAAMIIAPEDAGGAHLRALAQLSRQLRRDFVRERLRAAPDAQSLYILLSDDAQSNAA